MEETKSTLENQLTTQQELIAKLENQIENYSSTAPNMNKLMSDMESDKIAASRAMSQNQTLKEQLEEMQQAFVHVVSIYKSCYNL